MRTLLTFTTTAFSMIAVSTQAADKPSNIKEWVEQASSAIEEKMEYPETASILGETDTHTFVVTVNRQGDILDVIKGDKSKWNYFDNASNRALRYVDLPDLPAGYKKDTLSFALVLDYSDFEDEESRPQVAEKLTDKQLIALNRKKEEKQISDSL